MHVSCRVVAAKTAAKLLLGNGNKPEHWKCNVKRVWHAWCPCKLQVAGQCRGCSKKTDCLPVLVIGLELQLGKVCFVLIFVAETNIIVIIFFELLEVVSTDTNSLCTYGKLQAPESRLQLEDMAHLDVSICKTCYHPLCIYTAADVRRCSRCVDVQQPIQAQKSLNAAAEAAEAAACSLRSRQL